MAVREILISGEIPQGAEPCDPMDPTLVEVAQDLWDTMRAVGAASLSAPQIGHAIRMILIDSGDGPLFILNPVITARDGAEVWEERCASSPGAIENVERAKRIYFRGMNLEGRAIGTEVGGREAKLIQHEVDHLR